MKFAFTCFLVILCNILYGQKNGEIRGIIVDEANKPLEKATVSVVSTHDSLVLAYTLSTDKGKFELFKLPTEKELTLHISHVNSAGYKQDIQLKHDQKLDLDTIKLTGVSLDEVVVTAQVPIQMKGDTLEYKADFFKTRPNASVEELLQLLPGLQVNVDGTIIYQGKQVSGVRVNNKDFFAQDLTIATRNLDASLVDIVQVIKDKGESKREILDDSDLPIIINLKTKKEFIKANFGKFYGGGGTRDRYESGALVNTFRDTLQISFIGYANNLSRNGFDYSELGQYGGMNRAENNSYSSMSYGGLQNKISVGLNANYDIGKKLKTNLMYTFDQQNDYTDNLTNNSSFYGDTVEHSNNLSNATYKNFGHKLRAFARYAPDTTFRISLDANIDFRNNKHSGDGTVDRFRDKTDPVQKGGYDNVSESQTPNYRHALNVEKKIHPSGLVFSISHSLHHNQSSNHRLRNSFNRYFLFNDSTIDQSTIQHTDGNSLTINNTFNLQVPLKKDINLDLYSKYNIAQQANTESILTRVNVEEYTDRNDVANDKNATSNYLYAGMKLNANFFKKLRMSMGVEYLELNRTYQYYDRIEDIHVSHPYWLPSFSLHYSGLSVSYNKRVDPPSFFYFIGVDSDIYPTSYTFASPYFENQLTQALSLRYYKFFKKSKINLNFSANYNIMDNSIGNKSTYDTKNSFSTNGKYQAAGTERFYTNINLNKTFIRNKTWNISWRTYMHGSGSSMFSMVNEEENEALRYNGSVSNTVTLSYKNKISFIPTYEVRTDFVTNAVENSYFRNTSNFTHSVGAGFRLDKIYKFRLESSYTVKNQPSNLQNDRKSLHLINASLYYPVMKKGELKLAAFDILNQNQNIYNGAYGNNIYYSEQLTLKQYFMLGFVYKFLQTGSKR